MLNIYYGSECIDKEKFIFKHIEGKTLLLVPDQFSLQAERDAFFYLGKKGLMDLRIVDFSALGHKVVNEVGGGRPPLIDKYGRHMLLTRIIAKLDESLNIFKGFAGKTSFIDMVNGLISEMKRFEVEPQALKDAASNLDGKSFLKYKLADIEMIYTAYQEAIEGKYIDSEDYITFYGEKILHSDMVKGAQVWIYGFDTFTPKNLLIIERILKTAATVNVVMTYDEDNKTDRAESNMPQDARFLMGNDSGELFELTKYVIDILKKSAEDLNEDVCIRKIIGENRKSIWMTAMQASGAPAAKKSAAGEETSMKENAAGEAMSAENAAGGFALTLVAASNIYTEAERAAAYILKLVRDEGYRFGEILVVCNDTEARGSVLRRTFLRSGIPVFMDKKRKVLHHSAVSFLLAFMKIVAKGYRDDTVTRLIKSGLLNISVDDAELLENYVYEYKIRGNLWKSDFTRGEEKYSIEELNRLNRIRRSVVDITETARREIGRRNTAAEKIKGLYGFLKEDFLMTERLEAVMEEQKSFGLLESAAETAQSWNVLCSILDQIVETIGEERISNEDLTELLTAGFEEVEVGLVPVNADSVIIGTLQRTRLSRIRALLVIGANEGVLPLERTEEGLLNEREKETLEGINLEISKRDDVIRQEERLALYRTFSLPEDKLYVSCSTVDEKGEEQRPAMIFTALKEWSMNRGIAENLGDVDDESDVLAMLTSRAGTLSCVANALRKSVDGNYMDSDWLQVVNWYEEKDSDDIDKIKRGMVFNNRLEALGEKFADDLYRGDRESLQVSASRLEKYSGCPFAHFIGYGLRAEEPQLYQMGAREIGDVYHECIMKFSQRMTPREESGIEVDDPASSWMTISREECRFEIEAILREEMYGYREGLLTLSKAEEYKTERLAEICYQVAWSLVDQVRKGKIKSMAFEKPFGRGRELPPVKVEAGGREVLIQGKIDRMDILNGADEAAVRIVDYKTGADSVNIDHFRSGYKLQLMIYLKAAMQGKEVYGNDNETVNDKGNEVAGDGDNAFTGGDLRPAGVFYFKIKDFDTDADIKAVTGGENALQERLEDAYKLEGIVLNNQQLIDAMDSQFDGTSKVIPIKTKKDGSFVASKGGVLLSDEDFAELYGQVDEQVARICQEICEGNIEIQPKRERDKGMDGGYRNSCRFCSYRSICMFDIAFEGCRFKQV